MGHAMTDGELSAAWREFVEQQAVEQKWPNVEKLSPLEALRQMDVAVAARLESEAEFVQNFDRLPVVAVAGLKNAGKSSLVSSFLSPENRLRVARSMARNLATHRFTLWLPALWENNAAILSQLKSRLAASFGHAPEALKSTPAEAIQQQTDPTGIERPLLAFDPSLDASGIALVDCPDIETSPGEDPQTNPRLRMLAAARDFCAGVIVVLPRSRIEVATVEVVLKYLPEAAQVFAINRVEDEEAHLVAEELTERLHEFACKPDLVYLAFSFRDESYRQRTPAVDPNRTADSAARLPFFFRVEPSAEGNLPDAVKVERSIVQIGAVLPAKTLQQNSQREARQNFAKECVAALDSIERSVAQRAEEVGKAAADLFTTVLSLLRPAGELRFKPDPEILDRMRDSVTRTAPKWMWPAIKANQGVAKALRWTGKVSSSLWRGIVLWRGMGSLFGSKTSVDEVQDSLSRHGLSAASVASCVHGWAARQGANREEASWQADAAEILRCFNEKERSNLSDEAWDKLTSEFWTKAPKGRAALTIGGTLVVGLALAAWIGVEPGSGSVAAKLVVGKTLSVTGGELLACLGLGTLSATTAGSVLSRGIEAKIGRQQLSNFFAIAADRLGVPRDLPKKYEAEFPPPQIEFMPHSEAYGTRERKWRLGVIDDRRFANLRQVFQRLST